MTVSEVGRVAAASVLLVAANLPAVTIDRLLVPPPLEVGSRETFLLDCGYSVSDTSDLTVEWFFKPAEVGDGGGGGGGGRDDTQLVYRWTPPRPPEVRGVLVGRVHVDPKASDEPLKSRLRVTQPDVKLSGEYTCAVTTAAGSARQSRTLLIYSGEHDLLVEAQRREQEGVLELSCSVKQVYPEPDLRLERFDSPIAQQHQWVQRSDSGGGGGGDGLFDARTTAKINLRELRGQERFVCRLALKHTTYQAMRELILNSTRSENIAEQPAVTVRAPVPSTAHKKKSGAGATGAAKAGVGTLAIAAAVLLLARC